MEKWLPWASILFSSALVLEIFKLIVAGVKARKAKKNNVKALPEEIAGMKQQIGDLKDYTVKGFAEINKKLDMDSKHFSSVDSTLAKLSYAVNHNAVGTELGLENDIIIFNALRDHKINGESEQAEKRIKDYLLSEVHNQLTVG